MLLGFKKRGSGAGLWNGFGGKIAAGESVEQAALRELEEEAGIQALEYDLRGLLHFEFMPSDSGNDDAVFEDAHVYLVLKFSGEPVETDEMQPKWFHRDEIPYDQMWPGDRYWLPDFLSGKKIEGSFSFGEANRLLKQAVRVF